MTELPSCCALGVDAVKTPPLPAAVAVSPSRLHTSLGLRLFYSSFGFVCCTLDGFGSAGELGKNIKWHLCNRSFFFFFKSFSLVAQSMQPVTETHVNYLQKKNQGKKKGSGCFSQEKFKLFFFTLQIFVIWGVSRFVMICCALMCLNAFYSFRTYVCRYKKTFKWTPHFDLWYWLVTGWCFIF